MIINGRTLWTTLLAVFVAAAALVTLSAEAQERPGRRGGRMAGVHGFGGPGPLAGLGRLDLTDEQREQIRAIVREARAERQSAATPAGDLHRQLREAVFADTPDAAKIDALKASIAGAQASALDARIALDLEIAKVLTPEQRARLREAPGSGRGPGAGRGRR